MNKFYKIKFNPNKKYTIKLCSLEKRYIYYRDNFKRVCIENYKLENKLKKIEELVDTKPYVAYTNYGELLYEGDEILEIIRGE